MSLNTESKLLSLINVDEIIEFLLKHFIKNSKKLLVKESWGDANIGQMLLKNGLFTWFQINISR
jgi:hypothetical protein